MGETRLHSAYLLYFIIQMPVPLVFMRKSGICLTRNLTAKDTESIFPSVLFFAVGRDGHKLKALW